MSMLQTPARLYHPLNPLAAGGDRQHAETLPMEPGAMQVLCPGGFVGQQLALNTGLVKVAACDRHGAPVGFEKIPALAALVFQTKDAVGNDAAFDADVHLPLKRFAHFRDVQILNRQQPDVRPMPAREFKRDHDVRDHQGMFQKQSADGILLFAIELLKRNG